MDDSVQDKGYSQKIEMVKRQYSGNAHGLVKGIGIVNLVHASQKDYHSIDFRVYAPDNDGKTKNDHFRDMLRQAFEENRYSGTNHPVRPLACDIGKSQVYSSVG